MPNWKKVIVSGSNAALNSLNVTNSVTASIFSGSFTGSLAGTASWANNAISASYALTASFALNGGGGGGGAITYHQTASAVTWSVSHSLNTLTPIVQVYDEDYRQIIPDTISGSSINTVLLTFAIAETGYAVLSTGGSVTVNISGSNATLVQSTPATTWSFYHGLNETYPVFTIFDNNDDVIVPLKIHADNANTASIYFTTARTGTAVAANCGLSGSTFESASYAATASYFVGTVTSASYALTASNVEGGTANYLPLWLSNTKLTSSILYQNATGIGISDLVPTHKLQVNGDVSAYNSNSTLNSTKYALLPALNVTTVGTETNQWANVGVYGALGFSATSSTFTPQDNSFVSAFFGNVVKSGAGNVSGKMSSYAAGVNFSGTGNVTTVAGFRAYAPLQSFALPSFTGTLTNYIGLLIDDITGTTDIGSRITNKWGIYQSGSLDKNYFAGATIFANGITGSLEGTASFVTLAQTASFVTTAQTASYVQNAQTASYVLNAVSASYALNATSASYITGSNVIGIVSNAISASYALNGGVTQLLAGPNITLSPISGKGQVTISSAGTGSTSFNTATGSYGSFYDTTTQTNPVANVARSMSFNETSITNGVLISGSSNPFNTYIKTENAGVYDIQFSAQLDKTDSGADEIVIWLRKNGIDLTDTATTITLSGNNDKQVAAWNWFVNSAANDYYQIIWYSADTDLRILAEVAGGGHPGIPSVIATVNRVDQFLSNTGSFSGSFNGSFTGSLLGTASYADLLDGLDSTAFVFTSSFNTFSSSYSTRVTNTEATASAYVTTSGSFSTRITTLETASGSFSTRVTNAESSITSLNSKTGSYATTGSNTFNGAQTVTTGYITLTQVSQSLNYADDAAAAAGGIPLGGLYRNGNFIAIRIV